MIPLLISVVGVVFAFGLVIFIHEFGHFFVAKKIGVKVEQFSFGFGKEIFGFKWGETRYTINWIPLGGYVKMAGETPEGYEGPVLEGGPEKNNEEARDKSREFMEKPWYQRIAIALAGPAMNYILAIALFTTIFFVWGEPSQKNQNEVGEVMAGFPAEKAGLLSGDEILKVEGEEVNGFIEIATRINERAAEKTTLEIKRGENTFNVDIVPVEDKDKGVGLIGIRPAEPDVEYEKIGIIPSFKRGVYQCWFISKFNVVYLTKQIVAREKPDLAGPIGITRFIVRAIESGLVDYLSLMALISVAIGLFNLFPIPLLDGGHVVYYLIEGIRGRPLSQATMGRVNMVGFAFLIGVFIFATFNDISRPVPGGSEPESATETVAEPVTE